MKLLLPRPDDRAWSATAYGRRVHDIASDLGTRLVRAYRLNRERNALVRLDARMLRDIGITRAQALREAERSCFDDPLRPDRTSARLFKTNPWRFDLTGRFVSAAWRGRRA